MDNYDDFPSRDYLNEYYTELDTENQFLLENMHILYSAMRMVQGDMTLVEIGGGPTVYQLLSASRVASRIIFTDYNQENLSEVKKWYSGTEGCFSWKIFVQYVAELEGVTVERIKKRVRDIPIEFFPFDITEVDGFSGDIVAANFCPESVTSTEAEFVRIMENMIRISKKYIVLSMLRNARFFRVLERVYNSFPVNEEYMLNFFKSRGMVVVRLYSTPCDNSRGYDGMMFIVARKTNSGND